MQSASGTTVRYLLALAVLAAGVTACSAGSGDGGRQSAPVSSPPVIGAPGAKPPVPTGAYLGASVNPGHSRGNAVVKAAQVAPLESAIRRPLAIDHHFYKWTEPFPTAADRADVARGSIPMMSWACGAKDTDVIAGRQDDVITARADAIKKFGHPVFLRWFWEMDLEAKHANCIDSPADYVGAWRHIWQIFHDRGVTNVAWVWCPTHTVFPTEDKQYYPGDSYVDWVAVDGYNRTHRVQDFAVDFSRFYAEWHSSGKPLMVAETGAAAGDPQVRWLETARTELTTLFPAIKALVYWDAPGVVDYTLQGAGLDAFRELAADPHFALNGRSIGG